MGLLRRLADRFDPERRDISSRDPRIAEILGRGGMTSSGQAVTPERATGVAAVHACVQLIAESIATLPLAPYRRLEDGDRMIDKDHSLYRVLSVQANQVQTATEFREQLLASVLLTGNGYAQKVYDTRGALRELVPLHPGYVTPEKLVNGRVRYRISDPLGGTETLTQDEVLHVRYRSRDGFTGLSPITIARETIGIALSHQSYEGSFWANGAKPSGVLKMDNFLSPEQRKQLKGTWSEAYSGVANSGKLVVLEAGMDYKPLSVNHEDAQFVESRRLTLEDIFRIFRVPPPAAGDLSRATYSNISELSRWLVVHTLRPWCVRLEQSFTLQLLSEDGRQTHFIEHNAEGLLRGDTRERFESYKIGREMGWLSANEIRQRENLNRIEGGDEYLRPATKEAIAK